MLHPFSSQYTSTGRQNEKATRGPKGPEWHQCRCYQWSRKSTLQNEILEVVTQTSSAA